MNDLAKVEILRTNGTKGRIRLRARVARTGSHGQDGWDCD